MCFTFQCSIECNVSMITMFDLYHHSERNKGNYKLYESEMQRVSVTCKVWTENKSGTPWHPPQGPKVRSVRRCCCVLSLSLRRGEMPSWCWLQRCLCQLEAGDRGHANSHCVIVCLRCSKGYGFGNSYLSPLAIVILHYKYFHVISWCPRFSVKHMNVIEGRGLVLWSYCQNIFVHIKVLGPLRTDWSSHDTAPHKWHCRMCRPVPVPRTSGKPRWGLRAQVAAFFYWRPFSIFATKSSRPWTQSLHSNDKS